MSQVCAVCGKTRSVGYQIVRRGLAKKKGGVGKKISGITKRVFQPNLQKIRVLVNGKPKRLKVCTSCIKAGKISKPVTKSPAAISL